MHQSENAAHAPVLVDEVMALLWPRPGATVVDATVGLGGHAEAIAKRLAPGGRLVGIDRDARALAIAKRRLAPFGSMVSLYGANAADLTEVLVAENVPAVDGVLMDLGVSSMQLDEPERGFSFRFEGPLDMRMDPEQSQTAGDVVNRLPARDLERILRDYGEERFAGRVAREIVRRRPLRTTTDLRDAVRAAVPRAAWPRDIDVATRTFQAVRIATNDELASLDAALAAAIRALRVGGRLVALSFHSLEDRRVKRAFADAEGKTLRTLTRRPVRPTEAETHGNPRARSARLRAAERIAPEIGASA
ncbi:MAG: 16S rRNA (cytosine(1402)-N(4))-methyltransferase RsmH [Armatimonadetes bacterium]|nr:16S rRNA (cytosine(1402)-N(4))-methyltransferase RsmH [Armatimonadota bacterium]